MISASNMRSKSQKKKDLFANLIAEAQDSFAKYNHPPQTMTLQQTESQKIKKMHSTSNLQQPVQNKTIAATGKADSKAKRLIFQGSSNASQVTGILQQTQCSQQ